MRHHPTDHAHAVGKYIVLVFGSLFFAFSASAAQHTVSGGEQMVAGHKVFAWAKMAGGEVIEAGVTLPITLLETPPQERGEGPAGAIAVLSFPEVVRQTTFLNHFQLHWEKEGHEPPVFKAPHFDFHFYSTSAEEVRQVSGPDPAPPPAAMIPAGFVYPGAAYVLPQMGVHVFRPEELERPFNDILILGYYGGRMTFIEPMMTREFLLTHQPIAYDVPVPPAMGRVTRFPTKFVLAHDRAAGACYLTFSDFVTTAP